MLWEFKEEIMLKKLFSILISTIILIHGAAYAAPAEINIDDIISEYTISTPGVRNRMAAIEMINDRQYMYTISHASELRAYDITDMENVTQIGETIKSFSNSITAIMCKDKHLIFGSGSELVILDINDDGTLNTSPSQKFSIYGPLLNLRLVDDILFVNANSGTKSVRALDVSDMSNVFEIGVVINEMNRSIWVEKKDSLYYLYEIQGSTHDKTWNGIKTCIFKTYSFEITDAGVENVTQLFSGIPEGTWPGYGDYSETGSLGFSTTDTLRIAWCDNGYLRANAENGSDSVACDEFIIDVTNPEVPVVASYTPYNTNSFSTYSVLIGTGIGMFEDVYGSNGGVHIIDYSDKTAPKKLKTLLIGTGDYIFVYENRVYALQNGSIKVLKLYDDYTINSPVIQRSDSDITVSVNVDNNISKRANMVLISAIYKDNKMIGIDVAADTIEANEQAHNFTATLDVSDKSDYKFKTWMIDNFDNMELLTDVTY